MDDKVYKEILESQLQWSKEQVMILDKMESKLLEMKKVAEIAAVNNLSEDERKILNECMEIMKTEYDLLEKQKNHDFQ